MQVIESCVLNDENRKVCLGDLKRYWRKDEYFEGLTDAEKFLIKLNLGIIDKDLEIDNHLDKYSKFPVQNRVVTIALDKKLDIDSAAKVALTGLYKDIKNTPCALPNPNGLLINTVDGLYFYDGSDLVEVYTPTRLSEFENNTNFQSAELVEEAITLKGVSVNSNPLRINFDKTVNVEVPTKISDLTDSDMYVKHDDVTDRVLIGSLNPISSNAVAEAINKLTDSVSIIKALVKRLETMYKNLKK